MSPNVLIADAQQALFGSQWLALAAILLCISIFLLCIAAWGRWLAATHPDNPAPAIQPEPVETDSLLTTSAQITPQIFAVIAAAVTVSLGSRARVLSVNSRQTPPSVESLMQLWSIEGRRQIYSSHKVR